MNRGLFRYTSGTPIAVVDGKGGYVSAAAVTGP